MISSQTKKTKKNTPTLPQPFPQRLPWEKRLAWPMPRCYHLELLVKHLLPPVTSVTPWRSKNHQRYHEIIGDPPQPKFALLTFNFFFLALDVLVFRSEVHHMRAFSGCSPTLLFQLVHDPAPQRNSQVFNCLKLEVIKIREILQTSPRIHKKEKREHWKEKRKGSAKVEYLLMYVRDLTSSKTRCKCDFSLCSNASQNSIVKQRFLTSTQLRGTPQQVNIEANSLCCPTLTK